MSQPHLSLRGVSKSFEGVKALRGLDLDLLPGEVHAVVGENGAGKSTMVKIISGLVTPDSGDVTVMGRSLQGLSPRQRLGLGLAVVYQDTAIFPDLSVIENAFMGAFQSRRFPGGLNWKQMHRRFEGILKDLDVTLCPTDRAFDLPAEGLCILGIVRALLHAPKALLMDEPTASLDDHESRRLFQVVKTLREKGVGILYISHRMEEIFELSDRVTVLRDGERISTRDTRDSNPNMLVREMVGRELSGLASYRPPATAAPLLVSTGLCTDTGLKDVTLELREGEILGLAGLVGAGRTRLLRSLFGLDKILSGQVLLKGHPISPKGPRDAIRLGISLVPEDRTRVGLALPHPAWENIVSSVLPRLTRIFLIRRRYGMELSRGLWDRLGIRGPGLSSEARLFSGGNQQKIVLGKWLAPDPCLLLLDDPTKGVDVGAKEEIHAIMNELCQRGLSILVASSELPELFLVCHRIAVMREGRIIGFYDPQSTTQEALLSAAFGAA